MSCLYILQINPLWVVSPANIVSHSLGCFSFSPATYQLCSCGQVTLCVWGSVSHLCNGYINYLPVLNISSEPSGLHSKYYLTQYLWFEYLWATHQLTEVVLARSVWWKEVKISFGAAVIWRLDWGWRICFPRQLCSHGCWTEALVPEHTSPPWRCLSILLAW